MGERNMEEKKMGEEYRPLFIFFSPIFLSPIFFSSIFLPPIFLSSPDLLKERHSHYLV